MSERPEREAAETLARARQALLAVHARLVEALRAERGRRRGELNLRLQQIAQMLTPETGHASQAGQDRVVDRLLGGIEGGTFVDVGGFDGVKGSNTLFFETRRRWTGLLIEPAPTPLAAAKAARTCPCLGVAVAAEEGEAAFLEVSAGYRQMSGLLQSYDPETLEQVRADPRHAEQVIRVPCRPLSDLLSEAGLPHPDFISLDIEGGEIPALSVFPFDRHRVRVWSIENNAADPRLGEIMRAAGYARVEYCGKDEIWALREGRSSTARPGT